MDDHENGGLEQNWELVPPSRSGPKTATADTPIHIA